jgi:hypothetical protein
MQSFTDKAGRTVDLSITPFTLARVKSRTGFELRDLTGGEWIAACETEPTTIVRICEAIALNQLDGMTVEDWSADWDGDTVNAALHAVIDAVIDFFPSETRPSFRKMMTKGRDVAKGKLAKILTSLDAAIEAIPANNPTGSPSVTSSQVESESTPPTSLIEPSP